MADETRQKLNTTTKLREAESEIVQLQEQLEEEEEKQRQLQLKISQLNSHVNKKIYTIWVILSSHSGIEVELFHRDASKITPTSDGRVLR